WQSYCVLLPEIANQKAIMQSMLEAGISTRRGIQCAHREAAYPRGTWLCACRNDADLSCSCLSNSEHAQDHSIILPLFHEMTTTDQERVASAFRDALAGSASA